jgi:hypothetical protein
MTRIAVIDFSGTRTPPQTHNKPSFPSLDVLHQRIGVRRRRVEEIYPAMHQFLHRALNGDSTKRKLLRIALMIAEAKGIKLDRLAKRSKECLICWFCEVAPDLIAQPIPPDRDSEEAMKSPPTQSASVPPVACPVLSPDMESDVMTGDDPIAIHRW